MRYMVIRTENLSKFFGRRAAVRNLTLDVEPGEIFGLLGPAGAGKTTTLRMLLDYIRPTSGHALISELDCHRYSLAIRRKIGYLPAEFSANLNRTGRELLAYFSRLRRGIDPEYIYHLAQQLDVDLETPFGLLNPAGRRKIGIIQAFMHRPELIILDEPTRSLDTNSCDAFYHLVNIARADGRTIFFTSSSLNEMERLCDRVGIIHHGKLVAVERGVHLRSRALRRVEMRFASPVTADVFRNLPNLQNLRLEDNTLVCTIYGNPDPLIKAASQFQVTDFISQTPSLEEVFHQYYGVGANVI